jgi:hypothetical protein
MAMSGVRKGANEARFRGVNERLEQRAAVAAMAAPSGFEIVCECAVEECTERIRISFGDYEWVRENPRAFVVVPGHADPECERIVAERDGYEVVEKFGDAGVVAELEDPRDNE